MNIVALLEALVNEILSAEEKFLKDPKDFYSLETSVKASADSFSAGFLRFPQYDPVRYRFVSLPGCP